MAHTKRGRPPKKRKAKKKVGGRSVTKSRRGKRPGIRKRTRGAYRG